MSRTFIRIVTLISLLMFAVLVAFSFVAFKSFETIVTQRVYDENIKELRIIGDNIKFMHESVQDFTFKLMEDASIEPLFQNADIDDAETYQYMKRLSDSFEMNPIFHSVSLYSGISGMTYSTLTFNAKDDKFFVDAIANYQKMKVLTPLCRKLPADVYYTDEPVFTYLYFQTDSNNKITKAMAVNMDAAWLCNYLKNLKGTTSKAYIVDTNSGAYIDDSGIIKSINRIDARLVDTIVKSGENDGSFISGQKNQELFTFLRIQDTGLTIVIEEPNTFLYQSLKLVRNMVFQIALGIAILATAAALVISRTIYNPFGRLFSQVIGPVQKNHSRIKLIDDVKLISDAFNLNQEKLKEYTNYKNSADNVLLESYIKSVLKEESSMSNNISENFLKVYGDMLEKETILIQLKIDQLSHYVKYDTNTKNLYKFSIMNVSEEIFGTGSTVKTIYMGEGEFVLLIWPRDSFGYTTGKEMLLENLNLLQKTMREVSDITISAYIGGYSKGTDALIDAYNTACTISGYAIVYNRERILDDSIIENHEKTVNGYDEQLEDEILDKVRTGNAQEAGRLFEMLVDQAAEGSIEGFMLTITRFFLAMSKTIEVLNKSRLEKIPTSTKDFYLRLAAIESLEDIREWFHELTGSITEKRVQAGTRHDALVESVKKHVLTNYKSELGLKGIAGEFKISQGYLGMIFKESTGMSVLDYINQIRLDKAVMLLVETDLSILEIMERTGFNNESNFYKLFKKRFGATPKAYRTDRKVIDLLK